MVKVDLGQGNNVGYLANLHNVAYQGDENLIGPFMSEAQSEFNRFRQDTLDQSKGEKVNFAVICGDFNFDNISPGTTNPLALRCQGQ